MTDAAKPDAPASNSDAGANEKLLFWACFIALIATAFGFIIRTQILGDWQRQFGLTETQKGEINGVGLWPFALSIVLFSLVIDKIGYGKAMAFAFFCHVTSAIITIFTPELSGGNPERAYWWLYIGTFIVALGNGTVEAVINPVVATLFPKEKTKWLNILHAGWPGGLVLGGLLALGMSSADWRLKVALLFLPVIAYGILMLGRRFPVNERVAAGVSYYEMLRQVGLFGALIIVSLMIAEVGRVFEIDVKVQVAVVAVLVLGFGAYTRSIGQPLFIFLLLIMVPLATTELGTDGWITELMGPEMSKLSLNAGWVLVYTSLIMMILRFFAGPIVHKLSPLGLLALSAALAALGLVALSKSAGIGILLAATLYGLGKTFFWPTMLGVVAEQFPKGGALTLNITGGVGMLAVGTIGAPLLGNIQDVRVQRSLEANSPAIYQKVAGETKRSIFGEYKPIKTDVMASLPEAEQTTIKDVQAAEKKNALSTVAIFPCIMLACYLLLIVYYQLQGGYKPKILLSEKEEGLLMMGGSVGPSEL